MSWVGLFECEDRGFLIILITEYLSKCECEFFFLSVYKVFVLSVKSNAPL